MKAILYNSPIIYHVSTVVLGCPEVVGALDPKHNSPMSLLLRVASSPHELHRVALI